MPIKVHIKNFQSIKDSEIVIDGLTVVTGQNNSGKSACMRAIRGVFTNTRGHAFVRHGESHCEVKITFPDGQTVLWEKGKTVNRYTVNGKLLDKVGHGVPPEVTALGVYPLQVANQTIWAQIAPQFSGQVFLVDQPGTVLAEAVADIDRVGALSRSLKASEQDRRQAVQDLKVRKQDKQTLESELLSFTGLDSVLECVTGLECQQDTLTASRTDILSKDALNTRLKTSRDAVGQYAAIDGLCLPPATQASQVASEVTGHAKLLSRHTQAAIALQALQGVDNILLPACRTPQALEDLKGLIRLHNRHAQAQAECAKLGTVPDSVTVTQSDKLDKVPAAITRWSGLKTLWEDAVGEQSEVTDHIRHTQKELAALQTEIQVLIGQMPACPTCGVAGHVGHLG